MTAAVRKTDHISHGNSPCSVFAGSGQAAPTVLGEVSNQTIGTVAPGIRVLGEDCRQAVAEPSFFPACAVFLAAPHSGLGNRSQRVHLPTVDAARVPVPNILRSRVGPLEQRRHAGNARFCRFVGRERFCHHADEPLRFVAGEVGKKLVSWHHLRPPNNNTAPVLLVGRTADVVSGSLPSARGQIAALAKRALRLRFAASSPRPPPPQDAADRRARLPPGPVGRATHSEPLSFSIPEAA